MSGGVGGSRRAIVVTRPDLREDEEVKRGRITYSRQPSRLVSEEGAGDQRKAGRLTCCREDEEVKRGRITYSRQAVPACFRGGGRRPRKAGRLT